MTLTLTEAFERMDKLNGRADRAIDLASMCKDQYYYHKNKKGIKHRFHEKECLFFNKVFCKIAHSYIEENVKLITATFKAVSEIAIDMPGGK